ncbi:MAG: trypsin-like peptidase domain-containing protein [Alphaproteobacteria bacterium]|nr:trypsin-like peptidase domain-containing protein [Alphaproteobacteria bacterium]
MRCALGISAAMVIGLLALPGPGLARTVFCLDEPREVVSETAADECEGRIVDAAEADRIRERRTERIRRALRQPVDGTFAGMRLAGVGTGFYVSEAAHILTNHHVIDECRGIGVTTATERFTSAARVVATDEGDDLALLQVATPPPGLAAIHVRPDWQPGDHVTIVGYPVQGLASLAPVGVEGQILRSTLPGGGGRLAINASIRRGTSGGPVLDENGLVVGVVFARIDTVRVYAETRRVVPDVAIAVDHDTMVGFLERHNVRFRPGHADGGNRPRDILDHARRFMARVQCYK